MPKPKNRVEPRNDGQAEPPVEYRYGSWPPNCNVPAQVVGEELERIRQENGGDLTPKQVVAAARPVHSRLHAAFEWRPAVAAQLYNEHVAANLIRCVQVHNPNQWDHPQSIAFVAIGTPKEGSRYTSTRKALGDAEMRQHVLDDAIRQLRGLQMRFEQLEELAALWAELDNIAFRQAERVAPKRRKAAKAQPPARAR